MKKLITVYGMTCDKCRMTITRELEDLVGVEHVVVNLPDRIVEVAYDESIISLDDIKEKIQELGYDAM